MSIGTIIAILGAGLGAILAGIGSAVGVLLGGSSAAGVLGEKPKLFGKLLVLEALPGTQGIYGFIIAVIVAVKLQLIGGTVLQLTVTEGWAFFLATLPVGVLGLFSALLQAKMVVASVQMTAVNEKLGGKGILMAALIETYAILGFLISILLVLGLK